MTPPAGSPRSSPRTSACASIGMAHPKTAPTAASLQGSHQRLAAGTAFLSRVPDQSVDLGPSEARPREHTP